MSQGPGFALPGEPTIFLDCYSFVATLFIECCFNLLPCASSFVLFQTSVGRWFISELSPRQYHTVYISVGLHDDRVLIFKSRAAPPAPASPHFFLFLAIF